MYGLPRCVMATFKARAPGLSQGTHPVKASVTAKASAATSPVENQRLAGIRRAVAGSAAEVAVSAALGMGAGAVAEMGSLLERSREVRPRGRRGARPMAAGPLVGRG